jgi:hypothetical protein
VISIGSGPVAAVLVPAAAVVGGAVVAVVVAGADVVAGVDAGVVDERVMITVVVELDPHPAIATTAATPTSPDTILRIAGR